MFKAKINITTITLFLTLIITSCTPVGRKNDDRLLEDYQPRKKSKKVVIKEDSNKPEMESGKFDPLIEKYWGATYRFGADGPYSFDCSGFTKKLFSEAYDYTLPRSSREQFELGSPIYQNHLQYGDLVFFSGSRKSSTVGHVGIYIGNSRFAHASTSVGVTITDINSEYYKTRYIGARRVLE